MPSSTSQRNQRTTKASPAKKPAAAKKPSPGKAGGKADASRSASSKARSRTGAAKPGAAKPKAGTAKAGTAKAGTAKAGQKGAGRSSTSKATTRSPSSKATTRSPGNKATTRSPGNKATTRSPGNKATTRSPSSKASENKPPAASPKQPPIPSDDARVTSRTPDPESDQQQGATPLLPSRRRKGGAAPFIPPTSRTRRAVLRRRWERRGFVPLSPGRRKIRHRILPRTVIGISFVLMAVGVGAAFSGAAFYAYYDKRLAENEESVARFVEGFDQQFNDATGVLDSLRVEAIEDIRGELSPLGDYVDDANGVIGLPATAGPSVWRLETRDEEGRQTSGAAFAVAAHDGGTAFVTSYSLVVSSVTAPNPPIELLKGDERLSAQLWTWDAQYDLALIVVGATVPPLELATVDEQVASIGARTFALSGVGGQGATASPGVLLDQSESGLQHTAPVGSLFVGGPLLTGAGKVIGVSTLDYQPHGIDPGRVLSAPDVADLCSSVLACAKEPNDSLGIQVAGTGARGATSPPSENLGEDDDEAAEDE